VAQNDFYTASEDQVLSVPAAGGVLANDSDPDSDALSAVLVAGPQHGTLDFNAAGDFLYTPDANFFGVDTFTYRVSDGEFESELATVTIDVAPVNDRPIAFAQAVRVTEDGKVTIVLAGSDVETPLESLTFTIVALPTYGSLCYQGRVVNLGDSFVGPPTLAYRPGAGVDGLATDGFQFVVNDAGVPVETSLPAVVTIEIDKAICNGQVELDASGILRIGGTAGNDEIHIYVTYAGSEARLAVSLNGQLTTRPLSSVQEIRAWGRAGNDHIFMPNVTLGGQLYGGVGDDILHGGFAGDLLFGGGGHDTLIGAQGDDLLLGGAGHDFLAGNKGNDLLVGGELIRTLKELCNLRVAWSSGAAFDYASVAFSDDAFDILIGGGGRDLFFASLLDFHDRTKNHGDLLFRV
jgi:VCBS repeat-containing protein